MNLPDECIIREVKEELGVDISNSCFSPLTFYYILIMEIFL